MAVLVVDITLAFGIAGIDWYALKQMPIKVFLSVEFDSYELAKCHATALEKVRTLRGIEMEMLGQFTLLSENS